MTFVGKDMTLEPREQSGVQGIKNEARAALKLLRRRRRVILLGLLAGAVIAASYAVMATNMYRAVAQISIDPRQLTVLELKDERRKQEPVFDSARVDSQVEAIRSDRTVRSLVTMLHLEDEPILNGTRTSALRSMLALVAGSGAAPSREERIETAVDAVSDSLMVVRTDNTFVIEIRVTTEDADLSSKLANGLAKSFINEQLDANTDITGKAAGWLKTRLTDLAKQASDADGAVAEFKHRNVIATADGKSIDDQALASFGTALTDAATATATAAAKLDQITAVTREGAPETTVSDSLTNEVVIKLRQQFAENSQRAADLVSRVGEDHQAVQRIRAENRNIAESIRAEIRRIGESYRSDYEVAKKREEAVRQNMDEQFKRSSKVGQLSVELLQLESVARMSRAAYETSAERYLQAVQNQSLPVTDVRIIAAATPPTRKFSPKRSLIIAIGTVAGTLIGLAAGVAIDFNDRTIRTRAEASEVLRCNCLGFLPKLQPEKDRAATGEGEPVRGDDGGERTLPLDHVLRAPFSIGAETIRAMRIAADQAWEGRGSRCIGIVSCFPGEGKTTVSANLAILLAQGGARVLLVDCDLRNPSLSRSLAPEATVGLPDLLLGQVDLTAAVVQPLPTRRFDFLPATNSLAVGQTVDLAASRSLPLFLATTRATYDYIIVDLPPLMPVVDVRAIAEAIDGFFLVISWNETSRDAIIDALNSAPVIWDRLIGSVLNKAQLPQLARYGEDVRNYFDRRYMRA